MKRVLAWLLPTLLGPGLASAVTTQSFVIDTSDAFEKGKLVGAAVHADGKLTRAVTSRGSATSSLTRSSSFSASPGKYICVVSSFPFAAISQCRCGVRIRRWKG